MHIRETKLIKLISHVDTSYKNYKSDIILWSVRKLYEFHALILRSLAFLLS